MIHTILENPDLETLDLAFARHVAKIDEQAIKQLIGRNHLIGYASAVDYILPHLERFSREDGDKHGGEPTVFRLYSPASADDVWTVQPVWMHHDGDIEEALIKDKSLARALCIALLARHGVEVRYSH